MRAFSAAVLLAVCAAPATAEVHFGSNVFIGGHDFSHQSFDRRHRLHVQLYDHPVRRAGCVIRRDSLGGLLKSCRLQHIHR